MVKIDAICGANMDQTIFRGKVVVRANKRRIARMLAMGYKRSDVHLTLAKELSGLSYNYFYRLVKMEVEGDVELMDWARRQVDSDEPEKSAPLKPSPQPPPRRPVEAVEQKDWGQPKPLTYEPYGRKSVEEIVGKKDYGKS